MYTISANIDSIFTVSILAGGSDTLSSHDLDKVAAQTMSLVHLTSSSLHPSPVTVAWPLPTSRRPLDPSLQAIDIGLDDMLEAVVVQLNPHPYIRRMTDLAHNTPATSAQGWLEVFTPYLTSASHEEFHLLTQHVYGTLLQRTEVRLWEACARLWAFIHEDYILRDEHAVDAEKVRRLQDGAYNEPPRFANFISLDARISGVSRRQMVIDVIRCLLAAEQKRGQCKRVLEFHRALMEKVKARNDATNPMDGMR